MLKISECIEKFRASDNDFRYMAVNDLMEILNEKGTRIDDQLLKNISDGLMILIEQKESISEVKNLAIKCLSLLATKSNQVVLSDMLFGLIRLSKDKNAELRDLAELGLKGVMARVPRSTDVQCELIRKVYADLLLTLKESQNHESKLALLDILSDTITRLGAIIFAANEKDNSKLLSIQTLDVLYPLLKESRSSIVKRTYVTLGTVSKFLSDSLFNELVERFILEFNNYLNGPANEKNTEQLKTIVSGFVTLGKTDTARFDNYLDTIYDLVISLDKFGETLYDTTLQAHESFILHSSGKMLTYKDDIIAKAKELISHDPNYVDEDEEEEEIDDEYDMEDEFEDEFDNTDDESWKVRRSSARVLKAIILSYPSLSGSIYKEISQTLVDRLTEREDMVRVDVFEALIVLIQHTFIKDTRLYDMVESPFDEYTAEKSSMDGNTKRRKVHSPPKISESDSQNSARVLAVDQLPKIIGRIEKFLSSNSIATKQVSLKLLKELNISLPDPFSEYIHNISNGVHQILDGSQIFSNQNSLIASNIKLDGLQFVKSMLRCQPPTAMIPHIKWICPVVVTNLSNNISTYSSEAFSLCSELIKLLGLLPQDVPQGGDDPMSKGEYLRAIFQALLNQVNDNKQDNTVRESSIQMLGYLFYSSGLTIRPQFLEFLQMLLAKLDSNFSKISTQALIHSLSSKFMTRDLLKEDLEVLGQLELFITPLTTNLSKMKQITGAHGLACLAKVLSVTLLNLNVANFSPILEKIINNIRAYNLQELTFALDILLLSLDSNLNPTVLKDNLAKFDSADIGGTLIQLELSSDIQNETAIKFAQVFFQLLIASYKLGFDGKAIGYNYISKAMESVSNKEVQLSDQNCSNLALLCSYIVKANATFDPTSNQEYVTKLTFNIEASSPVNQRRVGLQALGKISLDYDFSSQFDLFDKAITTFEENNSELRISAAIALGNLVSSNFSFMPKLIQQINENNKHRYLLLRAFKEIVNCYVEYSEKQASFSAFGDDLWNFLVSNFAMQNDLAVRHIAAECVGKLIIIEPKYIVMLRDLTVSPPKVSRALAITAIRYSIHNDSTSVDRAFTLNLKPYLSDFLDFIRDEDLEVRRLTITTLTAIAHHKPQLLNDVLPNLSQALENETEVKPELVRSIVMGPQTHMVDDGLENRKAAFECYYTLLDTLPYQIQLDQLLQRLIAGIKDLIEIKILAHLITTRLIRISPNYVKLHINQLALPLIEGLNTIPKNALKLEENNYTELIRSTLRLLKLLTELESQKPIWFNQIFNFQEAEKFKPEFPALWE